MCVMRAGPPAKRAQFTHELIRVWHRGHGARSNGTIDTDTIARKFFAQKIQFDRFFADNYHAYQ